MSQKTRDDAVTRPAPPTGPVVAGSRRHAVVDAHHHLWDPADPDQGWLGEPGLDRLRRRFTTDDLRAAARRGVAGRPVRAGVVAQSVATLRETESLLEVASTDATVAAVVGWVDLTGDVPAQVDRLRGRPGGGLLRGCRHLVQSEEDPRWLLREDVLDGLRALQAADLRYDVLVRAHQLPAAVGLAAALPGLGLVLDHAGKPDATDLGDWQRDVRALARHDNVVCKVSGLVTELDLRTSAGSLDAVWDVLLEGFGPSRLMWGSDWPVCLLAATYERWAHLTADLLAPLPPDEQSAVLAGTALDFYGLDLPGPDDRDDPQHPPTHQESA